MTEPLKDYQIEQMVNAASEGTWTGRMFLDLLGEVSRLREIVDRRDSNYWRPMETARPLHLKPILMWVEYPAPDDGEPSGDWCVGCWNEDDQEWTCDGGEAAVPLAWMPLPYSPDGDAPKSMPV